MWGLFISLNLTGSEAAVPQLSPTAAWLLVILYPTFDGFMGF